MRKQTEIALVAKRPHLFDESTLVALGINVESQTALYSRDIDFNHEDKESGIFGCGEGWLPIIMAFTESIDHLMLQDENTNAETEVIEKKPIVLIDGTHRHLNRLCIIVDVYANIDEGLVNKIKALKEFSRVMSGFICEICGTTLKKSEENKRVQCAVCHCRHTLK